MLMLQSIFGSFNKFVLWCHHEHAPGCRDANLLKEILVYGFKFLDFCCNVSSHNIYKIIDYHQIIISWPCISFWKQILSLKLPGETVLNILCWQGIYGIYILLGHWWPSWFEQMAQVVWKEILSVKYIGKMIPKILCSQSKNNSNNTYILMMMAAISIWVDGTKSILSVLMMVWHRKSNLK